MPHPKDRTKEYPAPLCRGDRAVYLILLLLLVSVSVLLYAKPVSAADAASVHIQSDGAETVYPLSEDRTVSLTSCGYHLTVTIENGSVRVTQSDCPDKSCTAMTPLPMSGGAIVCLPAQVIITVEKEGGDDDDEISSADIILG